MQQNIRPAHENGYYMIRKAARFAAHSTHWTAERGENGGQKQTFTLPPRRTGRSAYFLKRKLHKGCFWE